MFKRRLFLTWSVILVLANPSKMDDQPSFPQRWWFFPAIVALIYFALHMATSTQYGYFRDALYYLSCARHMDWGYVDHPPLIVAIAWIALHVTGTSLPALLIWPVMAGCARIVLTAAFARELGAQRYGIALAAVLGATPGVWWAIDHQFAMNAFEPVLWLGCAFVLLRLIKTENPRLWVAFGAIAGIGMETKYSMAIFGFALIAGLLLTPHRKLLFTPWLLAGGAVSFLVFLPNFLWNVAHHWPFFELMHNIRMSGRDIIPTPAQFIGQQILLMSPVSLPFWLAGLLYYFLGRETKMLSSIRLGVLIHGRIFSGTAREKLLLRAGLSAGAGGRRSNHGPLVAITAIC